MSAPLIVIRRLQLLLPNNGDLLMIRDENAAKDAEIIVLTTDKLMAAPSPGFEMLVCEPPLKARNPKNKMKPPKAAI